MSEPVLRVEGLRVAFDHPLGKVRAVDDVSFSLAAGERFGLAGESGLVVRAPKLPYTQLLISAISAGRCRARTGWKRRKEGPLVPPRPAPLGAVLQRDARRLGRPVWQSRPNYTGPKANARWLASSLAVIRSFQPAILARSCALRPRPREVSPQVKNA